MSRQEFGVVFNTDPCADPSKPVGVIDGFRQKGRARKDGLVLPSQMKDVLDDTISLHIRGQEYVLDETGSVIGAQQVEQITKLSSEGVPFEIGEGVFIADDVHFRAGAEEPKPQRSGYQIADGAAIGHRFQFDNFSAIHDVGTNCGRLPFSNAEEAEQAIAASLARESDHSGLLVSPGLVVGKAAVLWCVVSAGRTARVDADVTISDGAQVFAQSIGRMTHIAPDTIVQPSRGLMRGSV